jgi:glycosyltransferase involved in cell wall biosynthesis
MADFSEDYDLSIFTGNRSHSAAYHHHPGLWYCYTPVRAFYDLNGTFLNRQHNISRQLFQLWTLAHRRLDQNIVTHLDRIATISEAVRRRIKKCYQRDSEVIYPPVDTSRYRCAKFGDFWLSVNRLYPEKRIDLRIDCFRRMPEEQLFIVGGFARGDHAARYARNLVNGLPENVKILGEIPEKELIELYSNCKGHICTAMDEDFGLTPLEAMTSGKAVVGDNEGGYRETITDSTGILVNPCVEEIVKGVKVISANPGQYHKACIDRASESDLPVFAEKIRKIICTGT